MEREETILIVEDDTKIRNFISYIVKQEGFPFLTAGTAENALSLLVSNKLDLILLDMGLPDLDGMDVINKVREWSEIPIIVVSARDQDKEKAAALDAGADDYLTKPFSATELMARVRVALRHKKRNDSKEEQPVLSVGDLSIDLSKRQVMLKDSLLHLSPMEYQLLSLLFKNIGKVLTTQFIIRDIYGVGYGNDTQALRTLMASLRRKNRTGTGKATLYYYRNWCWLSIVR